MSEFISLSLQFGMSKKLYINGTRVINGRQAHRQPLGASPAFTSLLSWSHENPV